MGAPSVGLPNLSPWMVCCGRQGGGEGGREGGREGGGPLPVLCRVEREAADGAGILVGELAARVSFLGIVGRRPEGVLCVARTSMGGRRRGREGGEGGGEGKSGDNPPAVQRIKWAGPPSEMCKPLLGALLPPALPPSFFLTA